MNKIKKYRCVVTIAGSDPSGGAGIQADIKTISATGCYAASIITALTAQNTQGVQAIQEIPPQFVQQQINSVFSDLDINAVKIGMLHNEEIVKVIINALKKFQPKYVVLDPVMLAKSGCELLDLNTIHLLKEKLFPLVTVITPNLPEATKILGINILSLSDMESAAMTLGQQLKTNVLIKGGHLKTEQSSDVLFSMQDQKCHWFHGERIKTLHTHGTGCTLSSAISSYLAQDFSLYDSIYHAKQYLTKAIQSGSTLQLGQGIGPLNHFFMRDKT